MRPRQRARVQWWVYWVVVFVPMLWFTVGLALMPRSFRDSGWHVGACGLWVVVFFVTVWLINPQYRRRNYRRRLRAWMRTRSDCAWCGYELAGLERCPECGRGWRGRLRR